VSRDEGSASAWWLDAGDADHSVFTLARRDPSTGMCVVMAANLTPVPRHGYRVGLPTEGRWYEVLTTDDPKYGGSGVTNPQPTIDAATPWQGQVASTVLTLPPLGATFLAVR